MDNFPDTDELLKKWEPIIASNNIINEELEHNTITPLSNLYYGLMVNSAEMVDKNKTKRIASGIDKALEYLVRGSVATGLEYKRRNLDIGKLDINTTLLPQIEARLSQFIKPADKISKLLIDISHSNGRITYLPENKEAALIETRRGLKTASKRCFIQGANIRLKIKPIKKTKIKPQKDNKRSYSTLILWIIAITIGTSCGAISFLNQLSSPTSPIQAIIYPVSSFVIYSLIFAVILFSGRWIYRKLFK